MHNLHFAALAALLLAGCATAPVALNPNPPARWLMAKPKEAPEIPADEGNPAARAHYYAGSREECAATADQVRGLQAYIRASRAAVQ